MVLFVKWCLTTSFFSFNGLSSSNRRRFFPLFSELLLRDRPEITVKRLSFVFGLLLGVLMLLNRELAATIEKFW